MYDLVGYGMSCIPPGYRGLRTSSVVFQEGNIYPLRDTRIHTVIFPLPYEKHNYYRPPYEYSVQVYLRPDMLAVLPRPLFSFSYRLTPLLLQGSLTRIPCILTPRFKPDKPRQAKARARARPTEVPQSQKSKKPWPPPASSR